MQRVEVAGGGINGLQLLHPFVGMAEGFAEPEAVGAFQSTAAQDLAHVVDATAAGIGEHRQGCRALLECLAELVRIAPMEADPAGVLPGAAEAGKGQLQGAGAGMEAQLLCAQALQQAAADAEPEGVATR